MSNCLISAAALARILKESQGNVMRAKRKIQILTQAASLAALTSCGPLFSVKFGVHAPGMSPENSPAPVATTEAGLAVYDIRRATGVVLVGTELDRVDAEGSLDPIFTAGTVESENFTIAADGTLYVQPVATGAQIDGQNCYLIRINRNEPVARCADREGTRVSWLGGSAGLPVQFDARGFRYTLTRKVVGVSGVSVIRKSDGKTSEDLLQELDLKIVDFDVKDDGTLYVLALDNQSKPFLVELPAQGNRRTYAAEDAVGVFGEILSKSKVGEFDGLMGLFGELAGGAASSFPALRGLLESHAAFSEDTGAVRVAKALNRAARFSDLPGVRGPYTGRLSVAERASQFGALLTRSVPEASTLLARVPKVRTAVAVGSSVVIYGLRPDNKFTLLRFEPDSLGIEELGFDGDYYFERLSTEGDGRRLLFVGKRKADNLRGVGVIDLSTQIVHFTPVTGAPLRAFESFR